MFQFEALKGFGHSSFPIAKRDLLFFELGDTPRDHGTHIGILSVQLLISNPEEHMGTTQSYRILTHLMLHHEIRGVPNNELTIRKQQEL